LNPADLVPTNTAPKEEPKPIPKVVVVAASLGGAGVLAAIFMGFYFLCCRKKRKNKKNMAVGDDFFAPMAAPGMQNGGAVGYAGHQRNDEWEMQQQQDKSGYRGVGAPAPPPVSPGYKNRSPSPDYRGYRSKVDDPSIDYDRGYGSHSPSPPPQGYEYGELSASPPRTLGMGMFTSTLITYGMIRS
jgi:hypothetical protein